MLVPTCTRSAFQQWKAEEDAPQALNVTPDTWTLARISAFQKLLTGYFNAKNKYTYMAFTERIQNTPPSPKASPTHRYPIFGVSMQAVMYVHADHTPAARLSPFHTIGRCVETCVVHGSGCITCVTTYVITPTLGVLMITYTMN